MHNSHNHSPENSTQNLKDSTINNSTLVGKKMPSSKRWFGFNKENFYEIFRLVGYLKQYKINWFFAVFFMLLLAGVNSAFPVGVKYFSDFLINSKNVVYSQYLIVAAVFLGVYSLRIAFTFIQSYLNNLFCQKVVRDLRNDFFAKLITLPVSFFNQRSSGEIMSRFSSDIFTVEFALLNSSIAPFQSVPTFIFIIGYMLYLNTNLFLFTILLNIPIFFIIFSIGRRIKRISKHLQNSMASISVMTNESTSNIRVIKAFDMTAHETEKFKHKNQKVYQFSVKHNNTKYLSSALVELLAAVYFFSIVLYGAFLVNSNEMSKSNMIAFFTAFLMLIPTLKSFDTFNVKLQEAVVSLRRIFSILDRKAEDVKEDKKPILPDLQNEIAIKIKEFSYDDKVILKNINIKIKKGQIVAIVGQSGAGKTTIANLITRFFDLSAAQGKITFDSKDIRDYSLKSLRNQIGVVYQDSVVFNDSVFYNISYGKKDATVEEVIAASKMSLSHHFIKDFEFGYDQPVGEAGISISGGQKQRISIARTILKGSSILILDEATNSLDAYSEKTVNKALANLMKDKTVIIIAHKLSNIKSVDRIFVFKNGSVVEEGNFDELMQKKGEFALLYSSQSG